MCTGRKQRRHCFGIHPRQSSGPSCRYIEVNAQEKMHDVYCNTSSPRLLQSNTTNLVLHLMKGRILYAKLCINNRHQHVQAAKKRNNGAGKGIKYPTSEGSPALPPPSCHIQIIPNPTPDLQVCIPKTNLKQITYLLWSPATWDADPSTGRNDSKSGNTLYRSKE